MYGIVYKPLTFYTSADSKEADGQVHGNQAGAMDDVQVDELTKPAKKKKRANATRRRRKVASEGTESLDRTG